MHAPGALLHPRELTTGWLTAALDRGGVRADVRSFRWRRIGRATGIIGFVARVELHYRGAPPADAPRSIVMKFPRWGDTIEWAATERRFYVDHAADCPVLTPHLYFAALNLRARRWTLVIEDIGHNRALDDVQGVSADDAEVAVEGLARLHAWGYRQRAALDWTPAAYHETANLRTRYEANVSPGLRSLRGLLPRQDLDRFRGLGAAETAARELLAAEPLTLNHWDFRADNLFMTADRQLIVLDWETIRRHNGGAELGDFLVTSLHPDLLQRDGEALIARYASIVARNGMQDYSPRAIARDVRLGMVRRMIRSVTMLPSPALGRGRPRRVVRTWAIRASAAIRHFDAFSALPVEARPTSVRG